MSNNEINGYLSRFKGIDVDNAVERVQNLDYELNSKVDKTTTINNIPLEGDIELTPSDIGALSVEISYGKTLAWANGTLSLIDQRDELLSSTSINIGWGSINGTLSNQTDLKNALDGKQPSITSEAMLSSDLVDDTNHTHKFATTAQLQQIATNTSNISTINGKIPAQASSSNQLADKNFVNSSISTNTANFIGTFDSVAELEAYSGTLTNNDYAFVISTDSDGNTVYNRYKYTTAVTPASWEFEYALNNSSFTADQWAAIQSGITSADVTQITTNKNNISTINGTLNGFGDIVTHNVSEFATAAQGAKADTALQSINSTMVTNALGYTPYSTSNPDGFISGITSSDVTTALGYTPYNSTNPSGYISSAAISSLTDVNLTNVSQGQALIYNSSSGKWVNTSLGTAWGDITGTLSNQTDLQTALNGKQASLVSGTNIKTINNNSLLGSGNLSIDSLPSQTGNSGKFLTTNGSTASWATVDALPSQTGNSGKFLTTDGSAASWATVDSLPTQTGNSGKFLTTNGSAASWADTTKITIRDWSVS